MPLLIPNDSKLATEIAKAHENEVRQGEKGALSCQKQFVIIVPLVHALVYSLISGTTGVAIGASSSEVIRAIDSAVKLSDVEASGDDMQDYVDYNGVC